ncbi:MAG TPA: tetratricopeptide repeat protein [Tepidisphaeraceae bacterium]|nr:tetratricopeptide repeat protein [Tepidisphaeraceae bacterium]
MGRTSGRLGQLWQLPLLITSIALFIYSAYLFINPQPPATIDQKIDVARTYLSEERPDAALEQLNRILDTEKLKPDKDGIVHLLIATALEAGQQQRKISIPDNYERIIEQTQIALAEGVTPDADVHRRLADSYAALGQTEAAIAHYRLAIALDPTHAVHLRRVLIQLQLASDTPSDAAASIDDYLKQPELTGAERAWALAQRAGLLIDEERYAEARAMLADALKLATDPEEEGQFNYQLGYCDWKTGNPAEAERYLRLAREELKPSHPLDGDCCFVLGNIYEAWNDPQTANSYFQVVLVDHPEDSVAPLALLGRAICRIQMDDADAALTDLHDLTAEVSRRESRVKLLGQVIAGLQQCADLLNTRENYQGTLEVMAYEQELEPNPPAAFFGRLADVYSARADQVEESIADAPAVEQIRRAQQVRQFRTQAGDSCIAYSRALILLDDKAYGDALWRGIDLYDKAGDLQSAIAALELFVHERPDDKLAPDALLRLGRCYQAVGLFDKAIDAFQQNQLLYPKSLAASESLVPLAEVYIAKGPDYYGKAEATLESVIENNDMIDPSAEEFHQSLFELSQLYYRTERYEDAIAKLEEMAKRYPTDPRMPQITFLMADSYRKSASLLDASLASAQTGPAAQAEVADLITAKRDRLAKAKSLYDQVIDLYQASPPTASQDQLYLKLSHFYRADCLYDLGQYADAIKLYDTAAFRYQDDPSALAAYVQIVNAYCALGEFDNARTANERAKWLLRRMPPQAFQDGSFSMPKKYWDDWLKWTSESGVF